MKLLLLATVVFLAGCSSMGFRTHREIGVSCMLNPQGIQVCQVKESWEAGLGKNQE